MIRKLCLTAGLWALCMLLVKQGQAHAPVSISPHVEDYLFKHGEIGVLSDPGSGLEFGQVLDMDKHGQFRESPNYFPENKRNIWYWYRVRLHITEKLETKSAVIEFFDQTTDHIIAYLPDALGQYHISRAGAAYSFGKRLLAHKNFEFELSGLPPGNYDLYFKVKSLDGANILIVYRKLHFFIKYALNEYFTYGLFYGIIIIFSLHNLLMFLAVRKRQYLYSVLYILSVGLFEMSTDGIAFQYIWPDAPLWNRYAYGIALYNLSFFALVFTQALLHLRERAPRLYHLINAVIALRTVYFLYCLCFDKHLFYYRFIEFIPLSVAFTAGIYSWLRGFKPARFFVLAYSCLTIGFLLKAITVLGYARMIPGVISIYSVGFGFILEMLFLSFAIGDQVRLLRRQKDKAQDEAIEQMRINSNLKDSINQELEAKVQERTGEVLQQSAEIIRKSTIIEEQNQQLLLINRQLEVQAAEIIRMNVLLEKDNVELKTSIGEVKGARALSAELSPEEFAATYPDQETCNRFLAHIKWINGYQCIKCTYTDYKPGRAPHSRRCSKCNYDESVLYGTIFQNNRIPIHKAFYMVYLIYTRKGDISSYQLAERLQIRQSTCWNYALRIKKAMKELRHRDKRNKPQDWSKLILPVTAGALYKKI